MDEIISKTNQGCKTLNDNYNVFCCIFNFLKDINRLKKYSSKTISKLKGMENTGHFIAHWNFPNFLYLETNSKKAHALFEQS